jgi:hypothetical protein
VLRYPYTASSLIHPLSSANEPPLGQVHSLWIVAGRVSLVAAGSKISLGGLVGHSDDLSKHGCSCLLVGSSFGCLVVGSSKRSSRKPPLELRRGGLRRLVAQLPEHSYFGQVGRRCGFARCL